MRIWVDADSCPKQIRSIILKGAIRTETPVTFVADRVLSDIQCRGVVSFHQVPSGADSADLWIVEHIEQGDLIITRDVPCATAAIEKDAIALDDRGKMYTQENIRERLSFRDFFTTLREEGSFAEKHKPMGKRDLHQFAASFDSILQKSKKIEVTPAGICSDRENRD